MSRPPIPTAIHRLNGTFRPDRHGGEEPQPADGIPPCPEHLNEVARAEYQRAGELLADCRVITQADLAALTCYAAVWSRMIEAELKLKETGLIVKSPNGFPCISPYLSIAVKAGEEVRKWAGELGLSPAARCKLRIEVKQPETDIDKLMKERFFRAG